MLYTLALTLAITSPSATPKSRQVQVAMAMALAAKKHDPIRYALSNPWQFDPKTRSYWRWEVVPRQKILGNTWLSPEPMPKGMVRFVPSTTTQRIDITDGRYTIDEVPITSLEEKWQVSGGMVGIEGWHSDKYKLIPGEVKTWVGDIPVWVGTNFQTLRGIKRLYPEGTRFDDVLSNDKGDVFAHRVRRKVNGKWKSEVLYVNDEARPQGFTKLGQSCSSCHEKAGTGNYGEGLIPGGDTILSDPLDWEVVRDKTPQPQSVPMMPANPFPPQPFIPQVFGNQARMQIAPMASAVCST